MLLPDEQAARALTQRATGRDIASINRFPGGRSHYVYDVRLDNGDGCVVRIGRPDQRRDVHGAIYWHPVLKAAGVPLATILFADPEGRVTGFPALVLERLPGNDLGAVYASLTTEDRRAIAVEVAAMQRRVAALPHAYGYGYAFSYDDPGLLTSWPAVLGAHLERSRRRISEAGVFDERVVLRVQATIDAYAGYFASVPPAPFLDDTTTQNVIVNGGRLTGIVDVDVVCFGDPLRTPALTRMALLSMEVMTDYVETWIETLRPDDRQLRAMEVYTAMYCVDFMAELGHAFNREAAPPVDEIYRTRLLRVLDEVLGAL